MAALQAAPARPAELAASPDETGAVGTPRAQVYLKLAVPAPEAMVASVQPVCFRAEVSRTLSRRFEAAVEQGLIRFDLREEMMTGWTSGPAAHEAHCRHPRVAAEAEIWE